MPKRRADAAEKSGPRGEGLLSIGDVAAACGISPDTIRVWERRYGRPKAVRLDSGHRRYRPETVRWLRRVAEALARGHRPADVVRLPDARLDQLLAEASPADAGAGVVSELLALAREHRTADLRRRLAEEARARPPRPFLQEIVSPFVVAVGRAWADGEIQIRHEHLATDVVEDVLRARASEIEVAPRAPLVVLATLQGERHGLGLRMAALLCAARGVHPHQLGTDVPNAEIAQAAEESGAIAVLLSVSLATGGVPTDRILADLRSLLPADVALVVGGAGARGARRGPRGVTYVEDLAALDDWLAGLAPARTGRKGGA